MRGVLLAGGTGTRMGPSTRVVNKHVLPVYDRPMIFHPYQTLEKMGCNDILIITSPDAVGDISKLIPEATYRVQEEPNGIAGALALAQGYVSGVFPVILGDNWITAVPAMPMGPTLFTIEHHDPNRFGVLYEGRIIEKPREPLSNDVIIGLYVYDERVFDVIKTLKPSRRGELEVTDINNWYLKNGAKVQGLLGLWSDMGTPDSLLEVALHEQGATVL